MRLLKSVMGGALGLAVGGPIGAILGASVAYKLSQHDTLGLTGNSRENMAFFVASFAVMGHIAKLDGRVRTEAINYAKALMNELNLDVHERNTAIHLFRQGKKANFQLEPVLIQLHRECRNRLDLLRRFIGIQLQTAVLDGVLSQKKEAVLWQMCSHLGVSRFYYERVKIQLQAAQYFQQQKAQMQHPSRVSNLADAYQVLGVTPVASSQEIKQAYRRLMSQHHPDKLAAKGLSDVEMNRAKEKTQQISKAYEMIQKQRG